MSKPAISVQLYSARDHLDDLDGTLAKLVEIGLRNVEGFAFVNDPQPLADAFAKAGVKCPTGHAPFLSDEVHGNKVPPMEQVFEAARVVGIEWLIDPFVDAERWTTAEGVDEIAARMNAAAEVAKGYGLRLGYHNHSQEITPKINGVTALEYFASKLDESVKLEVDAFWATVGGEDVIALLGRLGDRVHALHIKDTDKDVAGMPMMEAVGTGQLPAGKGQLPMAEVIAAAPACEYVVIEFDKYEGDVFVGIKESYDYLAGLGLE